MSDLADPDSNHYTLTATLRQLHPLRYTPAGVPCVECVLHHTSQQSEAGQLRQVELEAPAIAFESVAPRLADSPLDATYRFRGFLANKSAKSTRTVFHIIDFNRADPGTEPGADPNN